ncbi:MAG: hypothetical protein EBU93_06075, partial [Chlamydiae bacterium]|nr:hypothetical protein [Chlamydiota bacterium]
HTQNLKSPNLWINEYQIYFDPIESCYMDTLSSIQKTEYLTLLEQAQIEPKNCLDRALDLKAQSPSNPLIDNLVCFLYVQNRKINEAEQFIANNYQQYPDYFFAKINYADQLLRKKKHKEIPNLFPSDALKDNCNQRTKYHVIEYRSFMVLMSRYYLGIGNKGKAILFYEKAYQADPAHLSVIHLERTIHGPRLIRYCKQQIQRLLTRLTHSFTGSK